MSRLVRWSFGLAMLAGLGSSAAMGQGPTLPDATPAGSPGGSNSTLGPSPGAGAGGFSNVPGSGDNPLGGRPGASTSRAPTSISTPGPTNMGAAGRGIIATPAPLAAAEIPVYGSLDFPSIIDDEGPEGGMTLDSAIERLVRENLYLRGQSFEIPQAEADVITAGLRANPVFYADSQLIPYGAYTRQRPGGQTQYDVNISYPLDVSRKRAARVRSATAAKRVLEEQYRDAVRVQIDNLYTVYIDVLAARAYLRYAEASVEGLEAILKPIADQVKQGLKTDVEMNRVEVQLLTAEQGREDANEALLKAKRNLANLLNIPPDQAPGIDLRGGSETPSSTPRARISSSRSPWRTGRTWSRIAWESPAPRPTSSSSWRTASRTCTSSTSPTRSRTIRPTG